MENEKRIGQVEQVVGVLSSHNKELCHGLCDINERIFNSL